MCVGPVCREPPQAMAQQRKLFDKMQNVFVNFQHRHDRVQKLAAHMPPYLVDKASKLREDIEKALQILGEPDPKFSDEDVATGQALYAEAVRVSTAMHTQLREAPPGRYLPGSCRHAVGVHSGS